MISDITYLNDIVPRQSLHVPTIILWLYCVSKKMFIPVPRSSSKTPTFIRVRSFSPLPKTMCITHNPWTQRTVMGPTSSRTWTWLCISHKQQMQNVVLSILFCFPLEEAIMITGNRKNQTCMAMDVTESDCAYHSSQSTSRDTVHMVGDVGLHPVSTQEGGGSPGRNPPPPWKFVCHRY